MAEGNKWNAEGTEGNDVRTEKNNKKITDYKKKSMEEKKGRIQKTGWWGLCVNWVADVEQTRLAKEGNETELLGRLIKNVAGLCFFYSESAALWQELPRDSGVRSTQLPLLWSSQNYSSLFGFLF